MAALSRASGIAPAVADMNAAPAPIATVRAIVFNIGHSPFSNQCGFAFEKKKYHKPAIVHDGEVRP
jgi:hypothetical protein